MQSNETEGNCAIKHQKIGPFSDKLTLPDMIKKFWWETLEDENIPNEKKHLKEINPFDGSFRVEVIPPDMVGFIQVKSFMERAKEEGLI